MSNKLFPCHMFVGLSGLIDGCKNDKNFFVEHYEEKDAHAIIKRFISKFHDVNE